MGQAVADLPDPLESASPAEAQSADELLSQLAGDEIDRLLAESGGDAAAPNTPAANSIAARNADPVDGDERSAAKPVVAAVATAPVVDLDAVLDTAVADHHASTAERAALTGTVEHQDLSNAANSFEGKSRSADHSPQIELGDSARRLPIFLRPLEWLSSPLDPWPDQFRELLGKIGLLTLVNAIAVIAYVILIRRHHH